MKRGQKVSGGLVVTCRDGTELLGPTEEVLQHTTRLIQCFVICSGGLPVAFRWDHGDFIRRLKRFDHAFVSVIRFVREQGVRLHPRHKCIGSDKVVGLSGRQDDLQWIILGVHQHMDFGAQDSFASPNGLGLSGFFWAPALC